MALDTPLVAHGLDAGHPTSPSSLGAAWQTIIAVGGMDDQDAATITNPDTEITDATRRILKRDKGRGTLLRLRMGYDDGDTPSADPVVKVFGRTMDAAGDYSAWQNLVNEAGDTTATLTTAVASDDADGTNKRTVPDRSNHAWDLDGCDEVLVGVQTVYAVSAGDASLAFLEAKII
jgi:hypothetical protein